MEISVKQRSMAGRFEKRELANAAGRGQRGFGVHIRHCGDNGCMLKSWQVRKHKRDTVWAIRSLWCVVLVLLAFGYGVNADEKCPKGTNEQPEGELSSCVKDANDPNELWQSRWDTAAKEPNDPNELLMARWNAVATVLRNKELDRKLKEKIIGKIMSPIFDFELMAKLALGKTHWLKLEAPQHKRFTELFTERLRSSYLEKITLYTDEKVLFKPPVQIKNTIHIPVVLISSDKEVIMLYKFHKMGEQSKDEADEHCKNKMNERWKIYDVEIQGVSILLTYRSQFDDILRRSSVKELFAQLEKPPTQ